VVGGRLAKVLQSPRSVEFGNRCHQCNESSGLAVWLFPLNRQLKDPLLKVISLYCSYMKVDQPTWYLDSSSRHTNNNQYIFNEEKDIEHSKFPIAT
jgi:hypothetical protein